MWNTTISIKKGTTLALYFLALFIIFGLFFANWASAAPLAAELSISNASANEGAGELAFTVSRTENTDAVTVTVTSADGTASAGDDYVAFSDTITFTAGGDLSQVVTVTLNNDIDVELDETFTMTLSAPENATLSTTNAEGIGTIQNDDKAFVEFNPADFPSDVTGAEGSTLNFPVNVTNLIDGGFSLTYTVSAQTASASDFVVASGLLNFAGTTVGENQTISVNAVDDNIVENSETFVVTLGAASNTIYADSIEAAFGRGEVEGEITDNDSADVTIEINSAAESTGSVPFTVKLSAPASGVVSADVTTIDGLAQSASDYTALSGQTIQIPAGQLSANGSIVVNNDNIVERDENLSIVIDSINNGGLNISTGSQISGTASILNDDSATVTIAPGATTAEGNLGTSTMTFNVSVDNPVDGGFDVAYNTNDGSATVADGDFVAKSGTLSFNGTANESKTVSVSINGDSKIEPDENLSVTLGNFSNTFSPSDLQKSGSPASGIIENDDTIKLSIETGSVLESAGTLPFTITLDTLEPVPVPVQISTNNGSATTEDGDYVRLTGVNLVIPANQKSITSFVTINDDNKIEKDETLSVSILSFVSDGDQVSDSVPPASTGFILNDDSAEVVIVEPVSILEGDTGNKTLVVTAKVDKAVPAGFDIDYNVTAGTATAGADFETTSGTLTFTGTEDETQTFAVQIIGDEDVEPNETFSLVLDNVTTTDLNFSDNVSTPITPVIGTIIDNDTAGVTVSDETITEDDSGQKMLTFQVFLTRKVVGGFTVDFATQDDTATTADGDYAAASGTLTFVGNAAETQTFSVPINGDTKVEDTEAFKVSLSNISEPNVEILDGEGIGSIENDDTASLSIQAPISIAEGGRGGQPITFTVSLDNAVQGGLEVAWAITEDGATVADNDYQATVAPLVFAGTAGETQSIVIDAQGDTKVELDEAIEIMLGALTLPSEISSADVTVSNGQSSLTLENDDQAEVAFQGASLQEGTSDTPTQFTINAVLSAASDVPVTVVYSTTSGTAIDGVDFIGVTGTLTFTGSTNEVQSIIVEVPADSDAEEPKSFTVGISSIEASGRDIAAGEDATVIIQDDDSEIEPPVSRFFVYLPVTSRDYNPVFAPDLVVSNVTIFSDSVEVTIKNIGNAAVTKPFWIDSYINPTSPPTKVNQTIIDLGSQGFIWGVDGSKTGFPMEPGDEIVLTVDGEYYRPQESNFTIGTIPAGSTIYVQVDSFGLNAEYGAVEERHEIESGAYNNIFEATGP